jgi:hypothetical protein
VLFSRRVATSAATGGWLIVGRVSRIAKTAVD